MRWRIYKVVRTRPTWLGSLPRDEAKRELTGVIHETGGNLRRTSFLVGWNRQYLYEVLHRWGLVCEVMKARAASTAPIRRTKRRLLMDQIVIAELAAASSGMTEDEIFTALEESGLFGQPEVVAAYLASRVFVAA